MSSKYGAALAGVALPVLLLTVLIAGSVSTPARAQTPGAPPIWTTVEMPQILSNSDFASVYMLDANTTWVAGSINDPAGSQGLAFRLQWQGGGWGISNVSRFRSRLQAIVAVSDSNVWAVGEQGLIAHFDGAAWTEPANPLPQSNLFTLQMFGNGDEGWAAGSYVGTGYGPALLHYKNGTWSSDTSLGQEGFVHSLHFAGNTGWAVGSDIWRYSGGRWTKESRPPACPDVFCADNLNSVRALSAVEAWAVGSYSGTCGICQAHAYILHRTGGQWQRVLPDQRWVGDPEPTPGNSYLNAVSFASDGTGIAVGAVGITPLVLHYKDGQWYRELANVAGGPLYAVSQFDQSHAVVAGLRSTVFGYGYGGLTPGPVPSPVPTSPSQVPTATPPPYPTSYNPAERVGDPHKPDITYFPAVGHTLWGGFRDYWMAHGGLEQFGYPITEEFPERSDIDGKTYVVQYFERARFEWHPENRPPYDVLLGLLGRTVTKGRENETPFKPAPAQAGPGTFYFKETGHNVPPQFYSYWQQHGGLPVYGYPISEAFNEVSRTDGKTYLVQYFERNRFEYHPELPDPFKVSLGLLAVDILKARGWLYWIP